MVRKVPRLTTAWSVIAQRPKFRMVPAWGWIGTVVVRSADGRGSSVVTALSDGG